MSKRKFSTEAELESEREKKTRSYRDVLSRWSYSNPPPDQEFGRCPRLRELAWLAQCQVQSLWEGPALLDESMEYQLYATPGLWILQKFSGFSALHYAISQKPFNSTAFKALLACTGADLETRFEGATPLHHACVKGNFDVIELLCDLGADKAAPFYDSEEVKTPLSLMLEAFQTSEKGKAEFQLRRFTHLLDTHFLSVLRGSESSAAKAVRRYPFAVLLLQRGLDEAAFSYESPALNSYLRVMKDSQAPECDSDDDDTLLVEISAYFLRILALCLPGWPFRRVLAEDGEFDLDDEQVYKTQEAIEQEVNAVILAAQEERKTGEAAYSRERTECINAVSLLFQIPAVCSMVADYAMEPLTVWLLRGLPLSPVPGRPHPGCTAVDFKKWTFRLST